MDNFKKERKALLQKLDTFESATFSEQDRFLNELRQFIKDKNLKIDLDDLETAEHHLSEVFVYYQEIIEFIFNVYRSNSTADKTQRKERYCVKFR